jgi:hypothetical protein
VPVVWHDDEGVDGCARETLGEELDLTADDFSE